MLANVGLIVLLLSAGLWCFALLTTGARAQSSSSDAYLAGVLSRFAPLGFACAVAVSACGLAASTITVAHPADLVATAGGIPPLGGLLLLCLLVVVGRMHRQILLRQAAAAQDGAALQNRALRRRFLAEEAIILVATVAVSLTLTLPAVSAGGHDHAASVASTPEMALLGYALPEPPGLGALLTLHADAFGILFAAVSAPLYLSGVRALHRRGDRWPLARTVAFLAGVVSVLLVTCTGFGRYAPALFSLHMVQHMVLNMVSPLLLVAGAPVTLALRALPVRERRVLLAATHSRAAAIVSHPVAVTAIFVVSLYLVYFTPLFELAMRNHWGHFLMQLHFLASGFLFFWFVMGVDPDRNRPGPLHRVPILLTAILSHTVFAVVLVFGVTPIGAEFYRDLALPWAPDLLSDQALAGGISWVLGELVTVGVLVALIMRWFAGAERADRALTRRRARQRV
ncbi:cytochrome c oxidase assembly protein [Salinibacterium sp. SYSU T00001]|uniref:cytochrome c oxidase assembly protein n=1 Tax=Homoserinimonas sedimenticola TaxID=2986805 RepID=UPI0022364B06|nr:cytochrome c oxidase assembly protein [Salinibacterium sedimenticola]MCW4384788.1 cytochrome c oxidase assembly protein [Salinibacterium sedimenticola]